MRDRRFIATFLLALAAFVTIGGGTALLLLPDGDPTHTARPIAAATAPPPPSVEPTEAASATPAPPPAQATEFALLSDTPSVPHPDQPSRLVIPSIALDAKVAEVGVIVEGGKPVWDTA